jgi:hypothetical protein
VKITHGKRLNVAPGQSVSTSDITENPGSSQILTKKKENKNKKRKEEGVESDSSDDNDQTNEKTPREEEDDDGLIEGRYVLSDKGRSTPLC